MKAKLLKQILGTDRPTADYGKYIAVGSGYVPNLISVDKETLELSYALDTFHKGRESLKRDDGTELLDIWDNLQKLIDSGELREIIDGSDTCENPIKVYSFDEEKGEIIESLCETPGYPNTTLDGEMMYENTHFLNKSDLVKYEIGNQQAGVKMISRSITETKQRLEEQKTWLRKYQENLELLEKEKAAAEVTV